MKTINVSEATHEQLDWLVAKCEQAAGVRDYVEIDPDFGVIEMPRLGSDMHVRLRYTTNWAQMGSIIEREWIGVGRDAGDAQWVSGIPKNDPSKLSFGPTPLVAAARCYVTSKMGDKVLVPEEFAQ